MMLKEMSLYWESPNLWVIVKVPELSIDAGANREEG